MNGLSQMLRTSIALMACAGLAAAANPPEFQTTPLTDSRGFIDVWQLQRDVVAVDAALDRLGIIDRGSYEEPESSDQYTAEDHCQGFEATDDAEDERPSAKAVKVAQRAWQRCMEREVLALKEGRRLLTVFNRAWLPAIREAIRRGDQVAEVIMLNCDTTALLNRFGDISSCSNSAKDRVAAQARLKVIGFYPAMDIRLEPGFQEFPNGGSRSNGGREILQKLVLNAFRHGSFDGGDLYVAAGFWDDEKDDERNYRLARNGALIQAALRDLRRAFTIGSTGGDFGYTRLSLNRPLLRARNLAWGPVQFNDFGDELNVGELWRTQPFSPTLCRGGLVAPGHGICKQVVFGRVVTPDRQGEVLMPDPVVSDPGFEQDLKSLLQASEDSIARYLHEEPRWAVFLVNRVGHHEYVPQGQESGLGRLSLAWQGEWELTRHFDNWQEVTTGTERGTATLVNNGSSAEISIRTTGEPKGGVIDVDRCRLRYSGSSTFLPHEGTTALGQLGQLNFTLWSKPPTFPIAALAPLNPANRYKQVLMQCEGGESNDVDRVRFLLLAGDTLVEIMTESPSRWPFHVRHFQRIKTAGEPMPLM